MAKILGLSFYFHDSAAALVIDGQFVAGVAEERFSRQKHTNAFPKLAIEFCLEQADISLNDLDAIVFYEKPIQKLFRAVESAVETWPYSFKTFVERLPSYLTQKVNIYETIKDKLPAYTGQILFCQHHLSHAASAFYCSPFDDAAILTVDGVGEWDTTAIGEGHDRHIIMHQAIHFPHSIGLLYSALTGYLGFKVNDGEWKVMGLAAYGKPNYVDQFRKLIHIYPDGSFQLNMKYFVHHYSANSIANNNEWKKLFGVEKRAPNSNLQPFHEDLACSGQKIIEEIILALARKARTICDSDNLVIAGGVGLNGLANWRIQNEGVFKNVWIQPAAGDDGGALGAALAVSQTIFNDPRTKPMRHAYYGPHYNNDEIASFLKQNAIPHKKLDTKDLTERVADLICKGKIIGWFRGRMEFGPRALGNRSILADATNPEMKSIVNQKIKFREYFRPFAPSVPLEHVHEYFDVPPQTDLPFMIKVPRTLPEKRALIPAVTHEDGTSRVQTVRQDDNPVYHNLLITLLKKKNIPIVMNTSFNVRGEPIVCRPEEAYQCFLNTDMDALVLEDFLIEKNSHSAINIQAAYHESDQLEQNPKQALNTRFNKSKPSTLAIEGSSFDETQEKVLHFYKEMPFNFYSNSLDHASNLLKKNPLLTYRYLHEHFKRVQNQLILDIGCGSGWFVNACAFFYQAEATGIDLNPVVLKQARSVARFLSLGKKTRFTEADIFKYEPGRIFDIVNTLGVLHHTPNCHQAIKKCLQWVKPGGYFHLGLYHWYGRKPFLDHFKKMHDGGAPENALYAEFASFNKQITDPIHLMSWFRDQVLHPHETQHTYEEIAPLLQSQGFVIERTSLNGGKSKPTFSEVISLEKQLEDHSHKALRRKLYYPGFFTIWARKI